MAAPAYKSQCHCIKVLNLMQRYNKKIMGRYKPTHYFCNISYFSIVNTEKSFFNTEHLFLEFSDNPLPFSIGNTIVKQLIHDIIGCHID